MEKLEMMYEGKAKKIYATDKADEVVVYYDGQLAASDPLQINTVYGITLKNSVD